MEIKNWENTHVNLGIIKENSSYSIEYISTKPLDIIKVDLSCHFCTTVKSYKDNKLKIKYKSSSIPEHLKLVVDKIPVNKHLTVYYKDGNVEVLTFSGIIKNTKFK